jgi:hypothetical protein
MGVLKILFSPLFSGGRCGGCRDPLVAIQSASAGLCAPIAGARKIRTERIRNCLMACFVIAASLCPLLLLLLEKRRHFSP